MYLTSIAASAPVYSCTVLLQSGVVVHSTSKEMENVNALSPICKARLALLGFSGSGAQVRARLQSPESQESVSLRNVSTPSQKIFSHCSPSDDNPQLGAHSNSSNTNSPLLLAWMDGGRGSCSVVMVDGSVSYIWGREEGKSQHNVKRDES